MKYPKLRELLEAITALIRGPVTLKFPAAPSPAPEGFRGRPTYHNDDCVGCGACAQSCPARAITMTDDLAAGAPTRTLCVRYDHCIFCQTCERNCITTTGIVLETEYNMVAATRAAQNMSVAKELVVCEACGRVVAAREHLRWLYHKLGPLAYANPTVALASLRALRVIEPEADQPPCRAPGDVSRGDRMRVLCPVCRAAVAVII